MLVGCDHRSWRMSVSFFNEWTKQRLVTIFCNCSKKYGSTFCPICIAKRVADERVTTVGDVLRSIFPVSAAALDRIKLWLKIKGHSMRRALAIASFLAAASEGTEVVIDKILYLFGWSGNEKNLYANKLVRPRTDRLFIENFIEWHVDLV